MIRKTILTAMLVALGASTVSAQDPRVEISGTAGWTFSDGVNVGAIDDSPIRVDPKDAFSWGARLGFNLTPNTEIGFLFASQATDLEAVRHRQRQCRADDLQLPRVLRLQLRRHGRRGAALHPRRPGRDAVRQPRHPPRGGRRGDPVLVDVGGGPEDVPEPEVRPSSRGPLDAHVHQDGPRGLLVRPLLGLLHGRGRGVLEPVRALRRHHHPVLVALGLARPSGAGKPRTSKAPPRDVPRVRSVAPRDVAALVVRG